MKEVIIRTISGAFYISIILLSLFTSHIGFIGLFFIIAILCIYEYSQLAKSNLLLNLGIFSILYFFLNYKTPSPILLQILLGLCLAVNIYLLISLFSKKGITPKYAQQFSVLYIIFGFIFLTLLPYHHGTFTPKILMSIFIIIWSNDTFAYLIGKNFGTKKLMPSVSPKKTIEGFIGGLIAGIIASLCIAYFFTFYSMYVWLCIAILISVFGTIGDLIQSKIKRQAGVKDSGKLMPGHGGLYDRLDSIIYASPFIYGFIKITTCFF